MRNIILKLNIFLFFFFFTFNVLSSEFWSNKVDGPKTIEDAIKILEGKKLDPIEGIWFTEGLGTLLIIKELDIFKMDIVEGPTDFNGTWEATILKRDNTYDFIGKVWYSQSDGSYEYGSQSGQIELYDNYFLQKYDSLSNEGVDMDHKVTKVWPKDLYSYNNNINSKNKVKDQQQKNVDEQEDELAKQFFDLDWSNLDDAKDHYTEIPKSNSEVFILESEIYIKGQEEIDKFSNILFGEDAKSNDMVVVDIENYGYTIYIDYVDDGYVSLNDWKDVDSNELLSEMKSNAQEDITDIEWVFEPKINESKNVTYSYKISWKDGEETLETKIFSLGRNGYHDIAVVKKTDKDFNAKEFENFALDFANTIDFKDGFKHTDYKSGDNIAAVGIGGLVAGSLGVKTLAKAGVFAKILPFLVKFWWIILAPIVGLIGILSSRKKSVEVVQKRSRSRRRKKIN